MHSVLIPTAEDYSVALRASPSSSSSLISTSPAALSLSISARELIRTRSKNPSAQVRSLLRVLYF